MRGAPALVALMLAATLSGCVNDGPAPSSGIDACSVGVCKPAGLDEVDFQPGIEPLLSFSAEGGELRTFARSSDGWVWVRGAATQPWWLESYDETTGMLQRWELPRGHIVGSDGLAWAGGAAWLVHAAAGTRESGSLTRWVPGTDPTSWTLDGVPFPASPHSFRSGDWIVRSGQANGTNSWLWRDEVVTPIVANGTVTGAGFLHAGRLVTVVNGAESQLIWRGSGEEFVAFRSDEPISTIWTDLMQAAFIVGNEAPTVHIYETFEHKVANLGLIASDARITATSVQMRTNQEGANPLLRTWFPSVGVTDGFFLASPYLWDATDDGIWWLEVPRTDHRFDQAPNPTDFAMLLVTPS